MDVTDSTTEVADEAFVLAAVPAGHFATEAQWLAATAGGVVQTHGLCDWDTPHVAHVFTHATYSTHVSGWSCTGQYAQCRNCDDVHCMDCRCRVWHDECAWDCPACGPAQPEAADPAVLVAEALAPHLGCASTDAAVQSATRDVLAALQRK